MVECVESLPRASRLQYISFSMHMFGVTSAPSEEAQHMPKPDKEDGVAQGIDIILSSG